MEEKRIHKRIKSTEYRKFLDGGMIDFLEEEDILQVLDNINRRNRNIREARALVILLYYSGCRPVEALNMRAKDIKKEGRYVLAKIPAAKNGLPRTVYLPHKKEMIRELLDFAESLYEDRLVFWNFRGLYKRTVVNKNGIAKERIDISQKVTYHLKNWFEVLDKDITPYFLRHNRFSKLSAAGAREEEMRLIKGCKSADSIVPYVHLSSRAAKDIARKLS
jgi:integrase